MSTLIQLSVPFLVLLVFFLGTTSSSTVLEALEQDCDPDWWKYAVVYQVYPRSFKDENNDGTGDLKGIITKLPYLKETGIDAVWISPFYTSPGVDQGYDISDFVAVDPLFGTMDDFDDLMLEAKALGLKIVLDYVPNHSSDMHDWFIKSKAGEPEFEDFYVWKDGISEGVPPNNWLGVFKYSAWEFSRERGQYYLHQFAPEQPDLNFENPEVVRRMTDVLKFWLDKGVDGFRIDAIPHLFEDPEFRDEPRSSSETATEVEYGYLDHIYTKDLSKTFETVYMWREFMDNYTRTEGGCTRVAMTEAYSDPDKTMLYYGNNTTEGAHFTFNFVLLTNLQNARDIKNSVQLWLDYLPEGRVSNWLVGNHDQNRVASRLGPENVDGYNMLVMLLPGVAVTYNGEEIGQENGIVTWEEGQDPRACNGNEFDFTRVSRDFGRTPYHWSSAMNAGFNEGSPTWLPVSEKYITNNLAAQMVAEKSHYKIYKSLIALRKRHTLRHGTLKIEAVSESVLVFTRELEGNDTYVVIFNTGNNEEPVDFELFPQLQQLEVVLSSVNSPRKTGDVLEKETLMMHPHESLVLLNKEIPSTTEETVNVTTPIITTPEVTTQVVETTPVVTTPVETTPVVTTQVVETTPVVTTQVVETTPVETTPVVTTQVVETTPVVTTQVAETTPVVTTQRVETTTAGSSKLLHFTLYSISLLLSIILLLK